MIFTVFALKVRILINKFFLKEVCLRSYILNANINF